MKIRKQGSQLHISEVSPVDLARLIKCAIPLTLTFPTVDGTSNNSVNNIELFDRTSTKPETAITIKSKERKSLSAISLDNLVLYINDRKSEGLLTEAFIEIRNAENYGPLIEVLPDLNEKLVLECAYIDYNLESNRFTVAYFDFKNKTSNKVHYYEDNNSMLTFTEAGPAVITDNPGVTSVRELIC